VEVRIYFVDIKHRIIRNTLLRIGCGKGELFGFDQVKVFGIRCKQIHVSTRAVRLRFDNLREKNVAQVCTKPKNNHSSPLEPFFELHFNINHFKL
jgi:hypothetical protein